MALDDAFDRSAKAFQVLFSGRIRGVPTLMLATCSVALMFFVRETLSSLLGDQLILTFFVPAIIISAISGGFLFGAYALGLSLVPATYLGAFNFDGNNQLIELIVFLCIGLSLCMIGQSLNSAWTSIDQANIRLDEREAYIETMLATTPNATVIVDDNGVIVSANKATVNQFGYPLSSLLGFNVSMLMPEPYKSEHDRFLKRYMTTRKSNVIGLDRVVIGMRGDGSTFPMNISIGEVTMNGKALFIGFLTDLTVREQSAGRLQEMQMQLARLLRAKELDELATSLAHELNQPLTAISSYVQGCINLLDSDDKDRSTDLRAALGLTADHALTAGRIINHLRQMVMSGEMVTSVVDLRAVVEQAVALSFVGSTDKGVRVVFRFNAPDTKVLADQVQLQQVVTNFVTNALRAMRGAERRELTITIELDHEDVVVAVSDTGPGVSEESSKHLFEPFTSSRPGRMGVGLAISRKIIIAHQGEISVSNNDEGGATFQFRLPRFVDGVPT